VDSASPVGIVVDSSGASVVLGYLKGKVDFGGGLLTSAGNGDVYLVKYSASGGYLWSQRFGGTSDERPRGIAIDASGNVVITGFFGGTVSFGGAALTGTSASGFVAKYSPSGGHLWSRRLTTGAALDEGRAVGVDGGGNVIVAAGLYGTADFGGGSITSAGAGDIVLVKYDSGGNYLWSRRIGGASDDVVMSLAVDTVTGEFVAGGYFGGSVDFAGGGGTPLTSAGGNDAFVAKYSSSGTRVWAQRWGSTSDDKTFSVALDALGNVAATGLFTFNVDFGGGPIANAGVAGSGDIFLVKLSPAGLHQWSKGFGSSTALNELGYGVDFDSVGNVLLTGSIAMPVDFGGGSLSGDGYYNAFLAKFDPAGVHRWSKRYLGGGAGNSNGRAITADSTGNVLATGDYDSWINFGGATMTSPGGADGYLVKLGP